MKSRFWPAVFMVFLCFGVATLYFESGPSSYAMSSRAQTVLHFNELKAELSEVTGEKDSGQVASWKARAELLAIDGMPLSTLASIYQKLLKLEFSNKRLRIRIESALRKLESLRQMNLPAAVESLGETLARLGRERGLDQQESIFGELDVLEIFFYRLYQSDPHGKIEALFYAGKAAHARYLQGIEYIDRYLEVCAGNPRCQNVAEAERMKTAHSSLMDKFEE
jgi:hypothetical protein